ncbi:MAG: outer membrane lipoprotein carrier protein LolA [Desulfomonile tiedjei]|uniref:Outer membrane lipoprotein carrier protein LolA n=1 Tax=Desulfomonile tiedjei TaxID=2358 RepID=A0A9D6V2T2_9BACT|nr:outer membrane lipoprotein carrier protein LolA [Desulfomonile tiedjei]
MKILSVLFFLLMLCGQEIVSGEQAPETPEQVVKKVQEAYSRNCCFKAKFDQLTVNQAMDLRDRFTGIMYVKKPGSISLDVEYPELQKVVVKGKSYSIYFPEDGTAAQGEVPPEMNVEHFFGFFANIGNLDRNFSVAFPEKSMDKEDNVVFLELTDALNPRSTYRIVLGIDANVFTVKRAIIYDALGNYNRFDLSAITFVDFLPDSRFEATGTPLRVVPSSKGFFDDSEKK